MAKREMSEREKDALRRALQIAVLGALMKSRRWVPRELAFQGGTCLHLVHGSPRFSEDIDVMVKSSIDLTAVKAGMVDYLLAGSASGAATWYANDLDLTFSEAKEKNNPFKFNVILRGKQVIGQATVKVELFRTDPTALAELAVHVDTIGGEAVPSLVLTEIYMDKVFALIARNHLAPRDVFDIAYIVGKLGMTPPVDADSVRRRLVIYNEHPGELIAAGRDRLLQLPGMTDTIRETLQGTLPGVFPLEAANIRAMTAHAEVALAAGIQTLETFVDVFTPVVHDDEEAGTTAPTP